MIKEEKTTVIEKNYLSDLKIIKDTIKKAQYRALVKVNSEMIMTFYNIGTIINKNKLWGNKYIERLSNDLREYGKGFGKRNLEYMMKFASIFNLDEIAHQPIAQIPWTSLLIYCIKLLHIKKYYGT